MTQYNNCLQTTVQQLHTKLLNEVSNYPIFLIAKVRIILMLQHMVRNDLIYKYDHKSWSYIIIYRTITLYFTNLQYNHCIQYNPEQWLLILHFRKIYYAKYDCLLSACQHWPLHHAIRNWYTLQSQYLSIVIVSNWPLLQYHSYLSILASFQGLRGDLKIGRLTSGQPRVYECEHPN